MDRLFIGILIFLLLGNAVSHLIHDVIDSKSIEIKALSRQVTNVPIPFRKCFKAEVELQADSKFIKFQPTKVVLSKLKEYSLKNDGSHISVLEELQSPVNYKHRHLLVFDGYLMVFFAPNIILVVEQSNKGFMVKNRFQINQLERFEKFKMYKLETKALLVIYNRKEAFLLDQNGHTKYTFDQDSSLVYLSPVNDDEFYAAEFTKGLIHYQLDHETKNIKAIRTLTGSTIGLPGKMKYVVDVNLNFLAKQKLILTLDAELGLIEIDLSKDQFEGRVVIKHPMCESFDSIERKHVVLLCLNQGHSTILEAYRHLDPKTKRFVFRKSQPIFRGNYLNDLHVTPAYYLVYSYKNIHIFWNTLNNRLPETLDSQSQIVLPGLQTFALLRYEDQNHLYTIEGGLLYKYELLEHPAHLEIKSDNPIKKVIKILLYGSCEDLDDWKKTKAVQACRLTKKIELKIEQEQYPREQDFSIGVSIVAILILVFLLVIWICIKKYKTLENEARKVLNNYQNKRARATRQI